MSLSCPYRDIVTVTCSFPCCTMHEYADDEKKKKKRNHRDKRNARLTCTLASTSVAVATSSPSMARTMSPSENLPSASVPPL